MELLLLWKSNKHYTKWACVCSLNYTACNAHAPFYYLCPTPLYNIFPHYLINGTIFEKKSTEYEIGVLIFSTTVIWNISHSKKNWARYDQKCLLVLKWSTRNYRQILMKVEFSRQIFDKFSNTKFHQNLTSRRHVVLYELIDRRTDRYDESLLVAFRKFVNAPWKQIFDVVEEKITSYDNCIKHKCIVWKV